MASKQPASLRSADPSATRSSGGPRAIAVAIAGLVLFAVVAGFVLWTRTGATGAGSGSIQGRVEHQPGRDPRSGSGGSPQPVNGDPVVIADGHGTVIRNVTTVDGEFLVTVPVGRYTVREGIFGISQQVDVHKGSVSKVTLTIPAG